MSGGVTCLDESRLVCVTVGGVISACGLKMVKKQSQVEFVCFYSFLFFFSSSPGLSYHSQEETGRPNKARCSNFKISPVAQHTPTLYIYPTPHNLLFLASAPLLLCASSHANSANSVLASPCLLACSLLACLLANLAAIPWQIAANLKILNACAHCSSLLLVSTTALSSSLASGSSTAKYNSVKSSLDGNPLVALGKNPGCKCTDRAGSKNAV